MKERTLVLLHRDVINRGLIGEIISRFEKANLKIIAVKSVLPTREIAEKHYRATEEQIVGMGIKIIKAMKESGNENKMKEIFGTDDAKEIGSQVLEFPRDFITKGALIAMVLEGDDAIGRTRSIVGNTDPSKAEKGTIRGDFGVDSLVKANMEKRKVENLVHASDSVESAKVEISVWFEKDEVK